MQKNRKTKIICIFGGVYSSLGKGVIAASITRILKELKNDVEMIKLEPYLNVNSGLMSPYQHGEVYVTHDGGETDLDLGTYERLGGARVSAIQYITSGQVYHDIITRERAGKYNGKTIQVVPHVTNLFKEKIFDVIRIKKPAFLVIEIGGTVGDMESLPIVEALCQIQKEIGRDNFLPILCAPLIHLKGTSGELKTKPCQHAYLELSKLGIKAEFLILRSEEPIGSDIYEKMQAHCHIDKNNIFLARTLPSVYFLPSELYIQKIHRQIYRFFNLKLNPHANINHWNTYINGIKKIHRTITIGMVGKYMELHDSYSSVIEALRLAGWECKVNVEIKWIQSDPINDQNVKTILRGVDGIIVPGGFGGRGTDGIICAIKYARINHLPFLGICYGMQLATIEFATNVLKMKGANSTEINPKTKYPIFDYIDGRMRLGEQLCVINDQTTLAYQIYGKQFVPQRHRHRWEFNNRYLKQFHDAGYLISAHSNDKERTAEMAELKKHPFFFGVQFHPEFSSHPLANDQSFVHLIKAAIKHHH